MGQSKEEKITWELKSIYFSLAQTTMEEPSDIWQQKKTKYSDHFNMNYFSGLQKGI